jgi:hypothetical protein
MKHFKHRELGFIVGGVWSKSVVEMPRPGKYLGAFNFQASQPRMAPHTLPNKQ